MTRAAPWLLIALGLSACAYQPTLSDAREHLQRGNPAEALFAARAATRDALPEERPPILHVSFQAALQAGWSQEAARDYQTLRELTRRDDDSLLTDLAQRTLGIALRSQDPSRRLAAARLLPVLVDLPDGPAWLELARRDPEPEVRAQALALAVSTDHALEPEAASADPAPSVRAAAVEAARELATRRPRAALRLAQGALRDPDAGVRLAGVELLGALAQQEPLRAEVHEGLRAAHWDGAESVVREASRALCACLGPSAAWEAWQAAALPTQGPGGLAHAAPVLAWRAGQGTLAAAQAALASPRFDERRAALAALGPARPELEPTLVAILRHDPARTLRLAALEAFAAAGRRELLLPLLDDEDPAVRRRALLACDRLEPLSLEQLSARFDAADPAQDPALALRLAARGGEVGRRLLVARLGDGEQTLPALRALNTLTDPRLREAYLTLLPDPDPRVRRLAGEGLIRCGLRADRDQLVEALREQGGAADLAAAAALLRIQRHGGRAPVNLGSPTE